MKTHIKNPFTGLGGASTRSRVLPALIASLGLILGAFDSQAGVVLTTLHTFSEVGFDGAYPGMLVQGSDGNLYGTACFGGSYAYGVNGYGTVFKITTNGALTALHSFTGVNDGANPKAALVQGSDGNFYGTASSGGVGGGGTVFKISAAGVLTNLFFFGSVVDPDGSMPLAALVQGSDGFLYGTTSRGGDFGDGTVFIIGTNGWPEFGIMYSFDFTNGATPKAGLVQGNDGNFYGTTSQGGGFAPGTVFKINANGNLSSLHSFTGADGFNPNAGLVQGRDGYFYGTTSWGGP
jgi:uncharacterized repeat protein (TIGR03803 family)